MKNPYLYLTRLLVRLGDILQPLVMLAMRLYWGWRFIGTGTGKLMHVPDVVEQFKEWGVPFPHPRVIAAGLTESLGGLLILVGFASRIASVPLIATMAVAYVAGDRDALTGIFSKPEDFVTATPFLFLLTAVLVLVVGPGLYSVDGLIARKRASGQGPRA
jgi:putative oxidoreductase